MDSYLIKIKNLSISVIGGGDLICDSDFFIKPGETVCLFGDSGSGKSVFSFFLLGFLNRSVFDFSGELAVFNSGDFSFSFFSKNKNDWNLFRSKYISTVFQNPSTSLNPSITCGDQILEVFKKTNQKKSKEDCFVLLKEVGVVLPEKIFKSFPHELSGGQKQRVVIAIALASNPRILVADEPTTALDPSVQRSILDLFSKLKKNRKIGIVLISHNIDLVKAYSDRIVVFKGGRFLVDCDSGYKKHLSFLSKVSKKIKNRKYSLLGDFSFYKPNFNYPFIKNMVVFHLNNICISFKNRGVVFCALNNISFSFKHGGCLGVVGGSGSGKTTLGRVLCGLEKNYTGSFNYPLNFNFLVNNVQMVYQDSYYSFNPKYTVGDSVLEIIKLYNSGYSVDNLFSLVSLDCSLKDRFPHELSGGQKQRVSIARALASNPGVIIFDESISALDLSIQFSILELIRFINLKLGISVIFISHDINSVYYLCSEIAVLKNGSIIDFFKTNKLFSSSRKKYTKSLISDSNFL